MPPREPTIGCVPGRCDPTPATVKKLYGSAFRCGKPGCGELLFKASESGSGRVRNSTVSHIHAAVEGGPRPLIPFDCETVKQFDNLLLLCLPPGAEIDAHEEDFPVELLRSWKAAQVRDSDSLGQNWRITDEEAVDAVSVLLTFGVGQAIVLSRTWSRLRQESFDSLASARAVETEWERHREKVARSLNAWDSDGNLLRAEPSRNDRREAEARLKSSLATSSLRLKPLARELGVEIDASRALLARIEALDNEYAELHERVADVERAASEYPSSLEEAVLNLDKGVNWLCGYLTDGRTVDLPIHQPVATAVDERQLVEKYLFELAERCGPFLRVRTRPFEVDLFAEVLEVATAARDVPETPHQMMRGAALSGLCGRAAAILRSSTKDELEATLRERLPDLPLVVRVELLRSIWQDSEDRPDVQAWTESLLRSATEDVIASLCLPTFWEENGPHGATLLGLASYFDLEPDVALAKCLADDSALVESVLPAIASYSDSLHSETKEWLGTSSRFRPGSLSAGVPSEAVARAIQARWPGVSPAQPGWGLQDANTVRLAGEFLFCFASAEPPDAPVASS